jgi:hypothetical protein
MNGEDIAYLVVTANNTRSHQTAMNALGAEVSMTTCMRMIAVALCGACCNKHHPPLFRRLA